MSNKDKLREDAENTAWSQGAEAYAEWREARRLAETAKPEGPAHTRPILSRQDVADINAVIPKAVPATPAPSQPAGAREWLIERFHWHDDAMRFPIESGNHYVTLYDVMELYAAQQTAAKDAEIERLTSENIKLIDAKAYVISEATRYLREQDSLREAIASFRRNAGRHDGAHDSLGGIHCSKCVEAYNAAETELDAALKAGKDGHEST